MDAIRKLVTLCLFSILLLVNNLWAAEKIYPFSVVPQQSATKTLKVWGPIVRYLSLKSGHKLKLKIAKDIPTFEQWLMEGRSDFACMSPYHYTTSHSRQGYQALARAMEKHLKGIIVVKKQGPVQKVEQLQNTRLAFPAPTAFGASLLPRRWLLQQGIIFTPMYVRSHDSVYMNVALGRFPAGGGVMRTLRNMPPEIRDQLRILHTTEGYTPHAFAAHPRVPKEVVTDVRRVLLMMDQNQEGRSLLQGLKVKGWEKAVDANWDDIRALKLEAIQ